VVGGFAGQGIKEFKEALVELVSSQLLEIQARVLQISDEETRRELSLGAEQARPIAAETIDAMKQLLKLYR
jgi:Sec-independent protein translocase protein TatA